MDRSKTRNRKIMSEFKKAWYISCPQHRKISYLFFAKCWKCEIKKRAKTISEAKLLIPFKYLLK